MATAAQIVREFHERMEARDWRGAGDLLSDSVSIDYIATGERFTGPAFLAMNEAYPEGWTIEVIETLGVGDRVAARVRVTSGDDVAWCSGYYRVTDGVITSGVEHWLSEGSEAAPEWRQPFTTPNRSSRPDPK